MWDVQEEMGIVKLEHPRGLTHDDDDDDDDDDGGGGGGENDGDETTSMYKL